MNIPIHKQEGSSEVPIVTYIPRVMGRWRLVCGKYFEVFCKLDIS